MSEVDEFFKDLPSEDKQDQNIFDDKPKEEVKAPEEGDKKEENEDEGSFKNRRVRRLEEKLQAEREMSIALNERLKVLAEQQNYIKETKGEVDPRLIKAFGTTDEGKELTRLFQELLNENAEKAKAEALREIEERQNGVAEAQREEESYIDSQLEALEDLHQIDLTSNAPVAIKNRKEFLTLVEKLSPKDENGLIKEYADFGTTFEIYKANKMKSEPSRAKELAERSMQTSANGNAPQVDNRPMTFARAEQEINRLFNN